VTGDKVPYRGAGGREHGDVPLPELAGLADLLRTQGLEDDEDLIRGISRYIPSRRRAVDTRLLGKIGYCQQYIPVKERVQPALHTLGRKSQPTK
jgi:hypothetical protein